MGRVGWGLPRGGEVASRQLGVMDIGEWHGDRLQRKRRYYYGGAWQI